jgi:phage terminase large subunit-like protein
VANRSRGLPRGIRLPQWSPTNETLEHFERFAYTLWVPGAGERFRLRTWQLCKLEDYFAGDPADPEFFSHLWLEPTGQGKSALLGALSLHHATYCTPRPRVFVIGGTFSQARNTTDAASNLIHEAKARRELLGAWWDPQEHSGGRLLPLWLDDQDVGIFARSAGRVREAEGGGSVEGKNPTLILVEEKHRHADGGAAVNTLITKTIKAAAVGRAVKVVTVTTAGTDRNSPLGRDIARVTDEDAGAKVQRDLRPGEYYVRAIDADGETVAHMWEVPEAISPPKDDSDREALDAFLAHVKRANPAEWITVKALRRIWRSMNRHGRWMFLRQNANQWVATGFAALDRGDWWRLHNKAGVKIPTGKGIRVFVGLDRASKWDSTAIVPVYKPPTGKVRVAGAVILESPRNGKRRKTRDVGRILETMREAWPDMVIVFDRNHGGGDVAEELEEEHGLTIIDHGQGTEFDLASMRLGEYVEEGKLEHDGNAVMSAQVLAAVMKETASAKRWRGEAPDDETQIDAFDALAMALHMATTDKPVASGPSGGPQDFRIQRLGGGPPT